MVRRIKIKSAAEIAEMREACVVAATVLDEVAKSCVPGVSTLELDEFAAERIDHYGAVSAFKGYRGFPGYTCISVNDEVVHGIPSDRRIEVGDMASIDVGVRHGGWVGDNARTVLVAVDDPERIRLAKVTQLSLEAGIKKAVAGGYVSDISHAIEQVVLAAGFTVVKEFVGHGVGRDMHEEPQIPNFGPPGRGPRLKTGMTLAIEPMVNLGTEAVEVMADQWTVLTLDRAPSAHFEHTVLVKDGTPEILTCKKMN